MATRFSEPAGRLAEVKTGGRCWIKVLNDQIDQLSVNDWSEIIQTLRELYFQIDVARSCNRRSFIAFSNAQAAQAAQQVFENRHTLPGVAHLKARLEERKTQGQGSSFDIKTAINMLERYSILTVLVSVWKSVRYIP